MDQKNEKTGNLAPEQMEKVSGGSTPENDGSTINPQPIHALDGYKCPGKGCGWALKFVGGKLYRCTNPQCPLFAVNQYPAGQ